MIERRQAIFGLMATPFIIRTPNILMPIKKVKLLDTIVNPYNENFDDLYNSGIIIKHRYEEEITISYGSINGIEVDEEKIRNAEEVRIAKTDYGAVVTMFRNKDSTIFVYNSKKDSLNATA